MSEAHTIYYSPALARGSDGTTYDQQSIELAISTALELLKAGAQVGEGKYPHAYKTYPYFHVEHAVTPIFEFPVLKEQAYDGKASAGIDRVVFGSVSKDYLSANYIGIVGSKDGSVRYLHNDLSLNGKTGVGEPFTAQELAEFGGKQVLSPPADADTIGSGDVKVHYHN
ncbi:guanine-specific ribonuclease n1/t1 [Grosmannia clavigera kw1407]|uniref:ribonuclease T1 n=1 Tax=Grosmannia clavigera (strain kw1407 / UAMH 11150) TaxID=655863 RepID=F0XNR3_GROCL|nr:guanine-specific ribonuclease n1/t1 [Grosmannia clavigera kw1407]EFX00584.1 guanine-specific ribonuclease n1/t1 [Grosmannia clavigera kw1407]